MSAGEPRNGRSILYVIGSFDLGGAERHLALVAPELRKLGWQPKAYCIERRGRQADGLEAAGVPVIGPPIEVSVKGGSAVGRALQLALSACKLFGILLIERPHIVHFFLPRSYLVGAPLAILARAPVRIMSRRSLNVYQSYHPFARHMERRLHGHMSVILANSEGVSRQLIEDEGVAPDKLHLIYNGVELSTPEGLQRGFAEAAQPCEPGRPLVLIIVANLIPYKGHADLFRALAEVSPRLPDWTLQCVGRDDGYGSKLNRLVSELGLQDRVQFLGERTDVASLLRGADVGILCSHQEGFANAILEGMAAELPMLVTDVGGNAEAVVDKETGLVVPPHDPHALGSAIAALAADKAMRQRMGAAGRARAVERFSLSTCVARYDRLYRSLIGEAAAGDAATEPRTTDKPARKS